MAAPAPAAEEAPAVAPAGGGQSAQLLQQITQLLTQLAQEQSDPQVQQAVKTMMDQATQLEGVVGQNDEQSMQAGLHNPGAPEEGAEGSPAEEAAESPGEEAAESGGSEHGGAEIHIKVAPKTFSGAKKAAMATLGEKGHFDPRTPKGETPSSQKTKNKAKG